MATSEANYDIVTVYWVDGSETPKWFGVDTITIEGNAVKMRMENNTVVIPLDAIKYIQGVKDEEYECQ